MSSLKSARRNGLACCTVPAPPVPWLRFIPGILVAAQTMIFGLAISISPPESDGTRLALQGIMLGATVTVMALLGRTLAIETFRQLRNGRITVEALFSVCLLGSLALSCQSMITGTGPVYFEVVAVLLIVYSVGHAIASESRRKALDSLRVFQESLAYARRLDHNGKESRVPVEEIQPDDRIRVFPGELIPVDGEVIDGQGFVHNASPTGEWISTSITSGDSTSGGMAVQDASLVIRAVLPGTERRVDRVLRLIENTQGCEGHFQKTADRFVRVFLPIVLATTLGTFAYWWIHTDLHVALFNALSVLLVACPCAAGLATPLVVWNVLGKLARTRLYPSGGNVIEKLARADSVIFDETGTLGDETLEIASVELVDNREQRDLTLAAIRASENESDHPVAAALRDIQAPDAPLDVRVTELRTLPGRGVEAKIDAYRTARDSQSHVVRIVRDNEVHGENIRIRAEVDGKAFATIEVRERIRESARDCVEAFKSLGMAVRIMTGDGVSGAQRVSHLAETDSTMTPEDKQSAVAKFIESDPRFKRPIFVGDGLNDAAAMAPAHTSIAMSHGSAVARESAAIIFDGDDLQDLPRAVAVARKACAVIRSNFIWAVSYNAVGMALAAVGVLHPVTAAILMAASSAFVSWRSFRLTANLPSSPAWNLASQDDSRVEGLPRSPRLLQRIAWLHAIGFVGQGLLLARIANLGLIGTLTVAGIALALTRLALTSWRRLPPWADMTLGMITIGGLGMNIGWWMDTGFTQATTAGCACHLGGWSPTWMEICMLIAGVPGMFLLRHQWIPFDWKRWCCTGMLILGVPGMMIGMRVGSRLALAASETWSLGPNSAVLLDYGVMMVGMCTGMWLPHALELAVPLKSRAKADPEI